jgi:hypothetical protein
MGRMVFRRNPQNHQSLTPLDWRSLTKDTVRLLRRQVTRGYAGSDTVPTLYTGRESNPWPCAPNCQGVVTTVPLPPWCVHWGGRSMLGQSRRLRCRPSFSPWCDGSGTDGLVCFFTNSYLQNKQSPKFWWPVISKTSKSAPIVAPGFWGRV